MALLFNLFFNWWPNWFFGSVIWEKLSLCCCFVCLLVLFFVFVCVLLCAGGCIFLSLCLWGVEVWVGLFFLKSPGQFISCFFRVTNLSALLLLYCDAFFASPWQWEPTGVSVLFCFCFCFCFLFFVFFRFFLFFVFLFCFVLFCFVLFCFFVFVFFFLFQCWSFWEWCPFSCFLIHLGFFPFPSSVFYST